MRIFFGVIFALLATLSGGCSLFFVGMTGAGGGGMILLVLAIGGLPTAIFGMTAANLFKPKPNKLAANDPWSGNPVEPAKPTDAAPASLAEPPKRSAYETWASKRIDDLPDEEIDERLR